MPHHINLVMPHEMRVNWLLAEMDAIPGVVNMVRKAIARGLTISHIRSPPQYVIGKGHLLFFYDKLGYLSARRDAINQLLLSHGHLVSRTEELRSVNNDIPEPWWKDYQPSSAEIELSRRYLFEHR